MSKYLPWKEFERDIVRKLKRAGFSFASRNWSAQFSESDKVDIIAGKYILQLKYGKNPSLRQAWDEANNAEDERKHTPVGVVRYKETRNTLVVISWNEFENLLKAVTGTKKT